MMKYTNSFDDDVSVVSELPPTRPCSTATTPAGFRLGAVKAATRRVVFQDVTSDAKSLGRYGTDESYIYLGDDATVASNAKSCGGNSAYVSLFGDNSDEETIHSSRLYSLHNYNPAELKKKQKKMTKETERSSPFCLLLDNILGEEGIVEDTVNSFKQVVYAFVLSPEDIDGVADTIHEARDEIVELEHERRWARLREL